MNEETPRTSLKTLISLCLRSYNCHFEDRILQLFNLQSFMAVTSTSGDSDAVNLHYIQELVFLGSHTVSVRYSQCLMLYYRFWSLDDYPEDYVSEGSWSQKNKCYMIPFI